MLGLGIFDLTYYMEKVLEELEISYPSCMAKEKVIIGWGFSLHFDAYLCLSYHEKEFQETFLHKILNFQISAPYLYICAFHFPWTIGNS